MEISGYPNHLIEASSIENSIHVDRISLGEVIREHANYNHFNAEVERTGTVREV